MSESSRNLALAHAIAHHAKTKEASAADIVTTASTFNDFILGDGAPTKANTTKAPAAGASPATKAAAKPAARPAPQPQPDEAAEETGEGEEVAEDAGVTKEDVGNAIASLINANLKDECGKLLKKYGAKSLSQIPEAKYAAFVSEAETLLMNA